MKLSKLLLRYFPPGIALEYIADGITDKKMIDLFDLTTRSNLEEIANGIMKREPMITNKVKPQLLSCLQKLQKKLTEERSYSYGFHKAMKHILPLTNVVFSKDGTMCLTGSFDRTCKLWNTDSGELLFTLDSHNSVVYDVSFNQPYSDRALTASFDKTSSVWDTESGERLTTMWGHTREVVVIKYDNTKQHIATGSMDTTVKIFDINTGLELSSLEEHENAVVKVEYSKDGRQLLTGSFDSSVILWDARTNKVISKFTDHSRPITNCKFNFNCTTVAASSLDGSIRLYDCRQFKCRSTLIHGEEVLDISFDSVGQRIASCGTDGICKVWSVHNEVAPLTVLIGHQDEISQACFSPGGGLVLTGSSDCTARLWNSITGECVQILNGHSDEIFSCSFTYDGRKIITASKDNTCLLWNVIIDPKNEVSMPDNKQSVASCLENERSGTMSV